MERRRIVAMGGGGFSMEPENPLLDAFMLPLARRERPRVCFAATASGDADGCVASLYRAFAALDCRPADLGCSTAASRTCARSCSSRTSSTSAAATPPACSPSGARTASTPCSRRRGRPASCCAGSAPG